MFLREDKDNSKPYVGHVVHKHIWLYFTILNSDHLFWVFNPELDRHLSLISVRFDTSKNCKCYCYPLGGGNNRILRRNITFIINLFFQISYLSNSSPESKSWLTGLSTSILPKYDLPVFIRDFYSRPYPKNFE